MTLLSAAKLIARLNDMSAWAQHTHEKRNPGKWTEALSSILGAERRQAECDHDEAIGPCQTCGGEGTGEDEDGTPWGCDDCNGSGTVLIFPFCPDCGADLSEIKKEDASEA